MQFLDAFTFIPSTEYHVDVTRLQDKGKGGWNETGLNTGCCKLEIASASVA